MQTLVEFGLKLHVWCFNTERLMSISCPQSLLRLKHEDIMNEVLTKAILFIKNLLFFTLLEHMIKTKCT